VTTEFHRSASPQLPRPQEQISCKADRDAGDHSERDAPKPVADAQGPALIEDPRRQYDPTGQRIGRIATGIRIDEPGSESADNVGVSDQGRDAPIGEEGGECRGGGDDGGFEALFAHVGALIPMAVFVYDGPMLGGWIVVDRSAHEALRLFGMGLSRWGWREMGRGV
jgi:hypothetical protein